MKKNVMKMAKQSILDGLHAVDFNVLKASTAPTKFSWLFQFFNSADIAESRMFAGLLLDEMKSKLDPNFVGRTLDTLDEVTSSGWKVIKSAKAYFEANSSNKNNQAISKKERDQIPSSPVELTRYVECWLAEMSYYDAFSKQLSIPIRQATRYFKPSPNEEQILLQQRLDAVEIMKKLGGECAKKAIPLKSNLPKLQKNK